MLCLVSPVWDFVSFCPSWYVVLSHLTLLSLWVWPCLSSYIVVCSVVTVCLAFLSLVLSVVNWLLRKISSLNCCLREVDKNCSSWWTACDTYKSCRSHSVCLAKYPSLGQDFLWYMRCRWDVHRSRWYKTVISTECEATLQGTRITFHRLLYARWQKYVADMIIVPIVNYR